MTRATGPQLSSDGKFYWNGQGWSPVPQEEEDHRLGGWIVLFILGGLSVAILVAIANSQGSSGSSRSSAASAGPASVPTATPAPVDPQIALVANYRKPHIADQNLIADRWGTAAINCGSFPGDWQTQTCRDNLGSTQLAVNAMLADLAATPTPDCLAGANATLHASLQTTTDGIQQAVRGSGLGNLATFNDGTAMVRQSALGSATDRALGDNPTTAGCPK